MLDRLTRVNAAWNVHEVKRKQLISTTVPIVHAPKVQAAAVDIRLRDQSDIPHLQYEGVQVVDHDPQVVQPKAQSPAVQGAEVQPSIGQGGAAQPVPVQPRGTAQVRAQASRPPWQSPPVAQAPPAQQARPPLPTVSPTRATASPDQLPASAQSITMPDMDWKMFKAKTDAEV